MIREPVVAGRFYPKEKNRLLDSLNNYCKANRAKKKVKGCILPHAGYIFSGKTACRTLSSIHIAEHIIIMGPNHTGEGSGFSVFPKGSWKTPLGEVEVDKELAQKLIKIIEISDEERMAMGRRGQQKVMRKFTIKRMVEETEKIYERLISRY